MTKASKKGRREPSNETPVFVVGGNDYNRQDNDSQNPSIITENLAKNITVRQNQNEIILMAIQGMRQDQNEKLDTILESVKSLEHKFLQNKKDEQAARREKCW